MSLNTCVFVLLSVCESVCVCPCVSARQVRNWGRDPALKDREERGWFCIHGRERVQAGSRQEVRVFHAPSGAPPLS